MADIDRRKDADHHDDQDQPLAARPAVVPAWTAGPRVAALSVSRDVYSRRAVLAAAYKLADRCAVLIDADGEDRWALYVIAAADADAGAHLSQLVRELDDQALRDELEQQFGAVRTLIVAQAFSEGNLLERTPAHAEDAGNGSRTDRDR